MPATVGALLVGLIVVGVVEAAYQNPVVEKVVWTDLPVPTVCTDATQRSASYLAATKDTVSWGHYYQGTKPSAVVRSGDTITIEMLTHQAYDYYEGMVQGDVAMEEIYQWNASGMAIPMRGATGQGNGKHLLTGPVYLCGAEPGDTMKIEILDLVPRVNPNTNKTFGSNEASNWGYQYRIPFVGDNSTNGPHAHESVIIYELVKAPGASKEVMYVAPRFSYKNVPAVVPCQPQDLASRTLPRTYANHPYVCPDNSPSAGNYTYGPGYQIPCIDGYQTIPKITFGGTPVNMSKVTIDTSINGTFKVPTNLFIGQVGLAQDMNVPFTSTTPTNIGGNVDNRRLGKGSTLYLPIKVYGGMLSMGDTHAAQGDSEYDGTAIETSMTGTFKITLIKKGAEPDHVPAKYGLDVPMIENANEWVLINYAYTDYITELLGTNVSGSIVTNPMLVIASLGADLNKAFANTATHTRDWLMGSQGLSEDAANSAMTTGLDFAVTQVVDQNWGVHTVIPKYLFDNKTDGTEYDPYLPKTIAGTSLNATCTQTVFYAFP